jgi:hypothetical protein
MTSTNDDEYIAHVQQVINTEYHEPTYKRPIIRPRAPPVPSTYKGAQVNKVVNDIIKSVKPFKNNIKRTIYQERTSDYFRILKRNNEYYNIPFITPDIQEHIIIIKPVIIPEKHIDYLDQIQVNMCILKNGHIRVKLVISQAQLYEKYYSQLKQPPLKALINTYTNLGYSDAFIQSFIGNHHKRLVRCAKIDLDKIFAKPARTKRKTGPPKTKKVIGANGEEEEIVADVEEEEVEEEEGDTPEEDEAMVDDNEDVDNEEAGEDGVLADYE